jgi:hypothetical protein
MIIVTEIFLTCVASLAHFLGDCLQVYNFDPDTAFYVPNSAMQEE